MTTTTKRKKAHLHFVLAIAVALGCSSATLGGALATLAIQNPAGQAPVA